MDPKRTMAPGADSDPDLGGGLSSADAVATENRKKLILAAVDFREMAFKCQFNAKVLEDIALTGSDQQVLRALEAAGVDSDIPGGAN